LNSHIACVEKLFEIYFLYITLCLHKEVAVQNALKYKSTYSVHTYYINEDIDDNFLTR